MHKRSLRQHPSHRSYNLPRNHCAPDSRTVDNIHLDQDHTHAPAGNPVASSTAETRDNYRPSHNMHRRDNHNHRRISSGQHRFHRVHNNDQEDTLHLNGNHPSKCTSQIQNSTRPKSTLNQSNSYAADAPVHLHERNKSDLRAKSVNIVVFDASYPVMIEPTPCSCQCVPASLPS